MIAFLGGMFDPPHFGHIKPAFELAQCDEIEQLYFLPCYQPSDKTISVSTEHRLAMLDLIEEPPVVLVSRYEIDKQAVSYTIDTLIALRQQHGEKESLAFILGTDAFMNITEWKSFTKLLELAHLIVVLRPGCTVADNHRLLKSSKGWSVLSDLANTSSGKIAKFENQLQDVSSSQVRNLIAQGQAPRYLVPGVIWNYIRRHQLYGYHDA